MVVKSQYKTKQAQGHRLAVEGSELTAASHPLTANCGCKIERVVGRYFPGVCRNHGEASSAI